LNVAGSEGSKKIEKIGKLDGIDEMERYSSGKSNMICPEKWACWHRYLCILINFVNREI
jgi:hypothetical protein